MRPPPLGRILSPRGIGALLLACLCLAPLVSNDSYLVYIGTLTAIYALAAVGLNIVHGFGGQISLGHGSLVAVGAYVTAILTVSHGWPVIATLVPAMAAAVVAAIVMSLPSLRLSRWTLAVITMAFALIVEGFLNSDQGLTGGGNGLVGIPGITFSGRELTSSSIYIVLLVLMFLALLFSRNIRRSAQGLALIAIRDSELVAQSLGIGVPRKKVWAFAISGIPAGLAGGMWASLGGTVSPGQFDISFSVLLFLVILIGGDGRIIGPVLGALMMELLPQILTSFAQYQLIIYAGLLLIIAILVPDGLAGVGMSIAGYARRLRASGPASAEGRAAEARAAEARAAEAPAAEARAEDRLADAAIEVAEVYDGASLAVEELSQYFGGVRALSKVSFQVPAGRVVGMIGPNGSGKTTLLNMISGLYQPTAGRILFDGEVVNGERASVRARRGIGRTFQIPRLLDREDVLSNVVVGASRLRNRSILLWLVRAPVVRREEAFYRQEALAWLGRFGIAELWDRPAGDLSHGDKRTVEIVRAMMSKPRLLLLDEPSSGLGNEEVSRLQQAIAAIARAGVTVVLVEHHIALVRRVADEIVVLDQGVLIANGPVQEVLADRMVVDAYLGNVMSRGDSDRVAGPQTGTE
jgi:ABC-type branched-subunit amino acid transport system ATPase component/ABC-type branched-subunit amino acid transport system permease subunit